MPEKNENSRRKFLSFGLPMIIGSGLTGAGLSGCAPRETEVAEDATQSLRRTEAKLILFDEESQHKLDFAEARGLCCDAHGALYVAVDNEILIIAKGKTRALKLSSAPRAIAARSDGTLCVAGSDRVEIYEASGARLASFAPVADANFTAIDCGTIAGRDAIFVANSAGRVVLRYDAQGRVTARIGQKNGDYPGVILPSPHLDVALARDGKVRLNNPGMHRVETHSADGTYEASWGVASSDVRDFCGCCNPTDFALLGDGRFITAEKGIPRVKLYSAQGKFEGFVAPPEAFAVNAMGLDLAALPDGRIAVLDAKKGAVRLFARKGKSA